jgi:uncharacterized protein (TIGR00369 family)
VSALDPDAPVSDIALAALLADARASGDPQRLVAVLPYARFLGIEVALEGAEVVSTMRYAEHLIGDATIPALHGGTLAALLEAAAHSAVLFGEAAPALPRTITFTIDYLRSGKAQDTRARAKIVRRGRRIAVVETAAYQDGDERPIATAVVHVLVAADG